MSQSLDDLGRALWRALRALPPGERHAAAAYLGSYAQRAVYGEPPAVIDDPSLTRVVPEPEPEPPTPEPPAETVNTATVPETTPCSSTDSPTTPPDATPPGQPAASPSSAGDSPSQEPPPS